MVGVDSVPNIQNFILSTYVGYMKGYNEIYCFYWRIFGEFLPRGWNIY